VPLEATLQVVFLIVSLAFSGGLLAIHYWQMDKEDKQVLARIQRQRGERPASSSSNSRWITLKSRKRPPTKNFGDRRIQRNRTGGSNFWTPSRYGRPHDTLWLTFGGSQRRFLVAQRFRRLDRRVANYITQLKRSGYFHKWRLRSRTRTPATRPCSFPLQLAGAICSAAPRPRTTCTALLLESWCDSLISTCWKYPDRLSCVM